MLNYAGPIDDGQKVLRQVLGALPEPAVNGVVPKPYVAHQKMFDAALPHGRHYYWKSHKLGPLTDETISVVIDQAEQITSPLSSVALFTQGGAVARVPADATAFANRDATHDINIVGSWLPDDTERRSACRLGPADVRRAPTLQQGRVRELHERRRQ